MSKDLKDTFPNISGFSEYNLRLMKRVYVFYSQDITIHHQAGAKLQNTNRHQVVDELENLIFSIPWRHQIEIIRKSTIIDQAVFYMQETIANNWSR